MNINQIVDSMDEGFSSMNEVELHGYVAPQAPVAKVTQSTSTGKRGRPAGAFNKSTIAAASALGLTPAEYIAQKNAKDPNAPKRPRGRPRKVVTETAPQVPVVSE
jgi:hypothetical protein